MSTYSRPYKNYVLLLLLTIYVFNQVDRGIFGFLMEPIKKELDLSDTQLGFLAGPALLVFYAVLGIPVARWADRSSRVNIISIAVGFWSGIVAASSAVTTFAQFVLVRIGVGVGEAGFTAVAQSLVSDYHSAKERTRALSILMLGIPLGSAASSLMAGWINQGFGWRAVFIAAGLPGILLAVLMKLTVREPRRAETVSVDSGTPSLRGVWATLWRDRTLRHLAIAQGLVNILTCYLGWLPSFFLRNHRVSSGELGTWLAMTAAVGGGGGIWLGGYLTSRYGEHGDRKKLRLMAIVSALIAPVALMMLWCPSARLALLLVLPFKALLFFCYAPTFSFVQSLSPTNMRATVASMFILIQMLAGGVIGVQLLGIMSDLLTPVSNSSAVALQWSLSLGCPLAFWAALHFWLAGRPAAQAYKTA